MRERSEEERRLQRELDEAKSAHAEILRTVAILMAAGFITDEKWAQALDLAKSTKGE